MGNRLTLSILGLKTIERQYRAITKICPLTTPGLGEHPAPPRHKFTWAIVTLNKCLDETMRSPQNKYDMLCEDSWALVDMISYFSTSRKAFVDEVCVSSNLNPFCALRIDLDDTTASNSSGGNPSGLVSSLLSWKPS